MILENIEFYAKCIIDASGTKFVQVFCNLIEKESNFLYKEKNVQIDDINNILNKYYSGISVYIFNGNVKIKYDIDF